MGEEILKENSTELIVDLKKIAHNINEIRRIIGKNADVMPVVKARAYGTQIDCCAEFFHALNIKILGVARVSEGREVRKSGFSGDIVVINPCFENEIDSALDNNLVLSLSRLDFANKLNLMAKNRKKVCKIHLEINTGMNRTGINPNEVLEFITFIKSASNLKLDGVYTHFSSSDTNTHYTTKQMEIFIECIQRISENFDINYMHCSNSGAVINLDKKYNNYFNLVRPGIAIYGHFSDTSLSNKINLQPATVLKSKVVHVHTKPPGSYVGYGGSFVTKRETKIAVVPLGYADGIPHNYNGKVLINGQLASIISSVNMDNVLVDVTDVENISYGDEVYFWDNKIITVEDVAENCGTINYEILSRISPRVQRRFSPL